MSKKRLRTHAIGDAALATLKEMQEQGFPGDQIAWGDCYLLDEIAARAGFIALYPNVHPLDRHKRVLDALDRDTRFRKFLFRCCDSNGKREVLVRAFWLMKNEA